jgi:hypothetical protein
MDFMASDDVLPDHDKNKVWMILILIFSHLVVAVVAAIAGVTFWRRRNGAS